MAYNIKWDTRAYRELKKLDVKDAVDVLNAINGLYENPSKIGKPLKGKFKGKRRFRVGNYRIIYWINEKEKDVWIISVGHRKEIYVSK